MDGLFGLIGGLKQYKSLIVVMIVVAGSIIYGITQVLDRVLPTGTEAQSSSFRAELRSDMLESEKRGLRYTKDRVDAVEKLVEAYNKMNEASKSEQMSAISDLKASVEGLRGLILRVYIKDAISLVPSEKAPKN